MPVIPSNRLLWSILAVAVIAAGAAAAREIEPLWVLAAVGLSIAALTDLILSLKAVRFPGVSAPPVVRLSKDRKSTMPLILTAGEGTAGLLRVGLALPSGVTSQEETFSVALSGAAPRSRVDWPLSGRLRGSHRGVLVCLERMSRFGFWALRSRQPLETELRVYPNLFAEGKAVSALFLPQGKLGSTVRRTVGRGREFERLRDYQPGDAMDEVHWKATAKRGRPIAKVFQAEKTQEICVVIDASRLSARPAGLEGKTANLLERYLTSAMLLLIAAQKQGDRFGLVVFDRRVRVFIKPGSGAAHYAACRDAIYALQPANVVPDIPEVVRFIRSQFRRRSLLFFLTDLSDPVLAEDLMKHVSLLSRQHLVFVNQMRPPEVSPLFTGAPVGDPEELYERLAGHLRWSELRGAATKMKPLGVTSSLLESESMSVDLLGQYLRVKERQAL